MTHEPRTPDEIRAAGNRLAGESSLYLRQHAHNPIDWRPWNDEALAAAAETDTPIFLSIGYSSCHWCHVMEREVFEHDDVAELLNRHFVPIKVDREERPDVDATYMSAVQAMTGSGGWPLSVFLTPDLRPFFGGTYFPHQQFVRVLQQIVHTYATQRGELEDYADQLTAAVGRRPEARATELRAGVIDGAVDRARSQFDPEHGGFQSPMKFPTPPRWRFLLHQHRKTGDADVRRMLETTLDAMAGGGIYDHVGGGFHRYTVDPTWTVPHFEKMLYDSAQLASLYTEAGRVFGASRYEWIARDTLGFLLRDLRLDGGAFAASIDADSGGEEGTYYVWTPDEITDVVGAADAPALSALLGVTDAGNFEGGRSVLTRRADPASIARRTGRDEVSLAGLFDAHRDALADRRRTRVAPARDDKVVTSWNALAIAALAGAARALDEPPFAEAATGAARFLFDTHRRPDGSLARASTGGRTSGDAVLDDYAFLAGALIELFQTTSDPAHLDWAIELCEWILEHHRTDGGGFTLTQATAATPLGARVELFDSVEPSGNAAAISALVRAAALTGRPDLRDAAESALAAYWRIVEKAPLEMGAWLDAGLMFQGPFYEVVIAGDADDPATASLRRSLAGLDAPYVVSIAIPAAGAPEALITRLPTTAVKDAPGAPRAFVCEHGTCLAPTGDPDEVRRQVRRGWTL